MFGYRRMQVVTYPCRAFPPQNTRDRAHVLAHLPGDDARPAPRGICFRASYPRGPPLHLDGIRGLRNRVSDRFGAVIVIKTFEVVGLWNPDCAAPGAEVARPGTTFVSHFLYGVQPVSETLWAPPSELLGWPLHGPFESATPKSERR